MNVQTLGVHESVSTVFPPEELRQELEDADPEITIVADDPASLADCDAVVTFEHRDAFLEHLEWVHSIQAGVDRFPLAEFEAAGVALTNSTGIHATSVGQTVAGYLLAFARRLHVYRDAQRDREWSQPAWDEAFTLDGESICVVGLGTLGRGIVDHAAALGMEVTGVRSSGKPVEGVKEVFTPDQLQDAISEVRFVAVAVPLTDDTRELIGPDELDAMREDATLINVARGPVVDQDALVEALEAGGIGGAALDVFEEEPLPPDSPLWEFEEVIVSPHCAAFTRDYFRDIADLVRESLARIEQEEELYNRVV